MEQKIKEAEKARRAERGIGMGSTGQFDSDIYGDTTDKSDLVSELPTDAEMARRAARSSSSSSSSGGLAGASSRLSSFQAKQAALQDTMGDDEDVFADRRASRVSDRERDYHKRRFNRAASATQVDAFAAAASSSSSSSSSSGEAASSYAQRMIQTQLERDEAVIMRKIEEKKKQEAEDARKGKGVKRGAGEMDEGDASASSSSSSSSSSSASSSKAEEPAPKRRRRWDSGAPSSTSSPSTSSSSSSSSSWEAGAEKPQRASRWDATPAATDMSAATPSRWDMPTPLAGAAGGAAGRKSRWDDATPLVSGAGSMQTPMASAGMMTPSAAQLASLTSEQQQALRIEQEVDARNAPLTDEELDALLPPGYEVLEPPEGYEPVRDPSRKLLQTPTPLAAGLYQIPTQSSETYDIPMTPGGLPMSKPEDAEHFAKLLEDVDEADLSSDELKEREIMTLLLKIKNGTPPQRKTAFRHITNKARSFGAGPLFNQILPLLMSPSLEDQERHLLVKVIDRVLYKLDDLVRPYTHKILVVIEPLLIDEDYYARVEGRQIISNLSKAAGLAHMISTMRPDIDNVDEYVRNTTARAFAVVASALGIHSLIPFLKAVCQSKRSWQARHTGIKIVQQIAILMGNAVLPHLKSLVDIIAHGLHDEQTKVQCITALSISALAEAAAPYGIESFDEVLRPLWKGTRTHRRQTLAAFLRAIGFIIPLMNASHANYYTREVMWVLIREFASPDEEMKKIVLKVVKQCVATEGVDAAYVRESILPDYFKHFWVRRMAADRRNYRQLVETTVELAQKVGAGDILDRVVDDLKDENETFRRMVMETTEKILTALGAADVNQRLEEKLIDGILYAFQEQTTDESTVMLNGFGVVINSLGLRAKAYLPQVAGIIKWRLNFKAARVRQQAADLIGRIAQVIKLCDEEKLLGHLGVVLYEYLGEEYPEVLGSILGGLKAVVNVVGMDRMTPPIKDLLPRLTPILKNCHEKVQENCIDLVGRIADRGPEHVPAKEWIRICFELLEMLKAPKKGIRRATVNTFGYIAKAIGPQDVLATLLNNLKVQERQNRVCTTVAIAIVAETCAPFTVLPALLNEYRVPALNVRNGVLKALSFLFEYVGEMGKDYVYAVTSLLIDALTDRDPVHRQTACTVIKHLSLGVAGLGREDACKHLLNHVWPNIFETSPHVINAFHDAVEGLRHALGPTTILQYVLQGLFHPARKVRRVYWKVYNTLFIASVDALVPAFPRVPKDAENDYRRWEMEMFI